MSTPNEGEHSALYKLKHNGKVKIHFDLEAHEAAFRRFYKEFGTDPDEWTDAAAARYTSLVRTLKFYGHHTRWDATLEGWILENVERTPDWISVDLRDYFEFV